MIISLTYPTHDSEKPANRLCLKAVKSASTERTLAKYREDLEKSLTEFAAAVSDYRKKYLAP